MHSFQIMALVASVVMPFWNIPLIVKIIKRKSSDDLSLHWLWGVWTCMVLMLPWACITKDVVLKTFSLVNFALYSCVVAVVMKYRNPPANA